ncbi:MAG: hypothetical protein ACRC63_00175, partial [Metamycoplasmataceae bacterium]
MIASLNQKIGLFFFRFSTKDAEELFNEIVDALELLDIKFRATKTNLTIYVGMNKIRVIGLNSLQRGNKAKKSGLSRVGGTRYIIRVFEEIFEFPKEDVLAIKEAVRGLEKDVNILDINICNPWSKASWYVKYCSQYQNWDVNLLKETGSQFGYYELPIKEGEQQYIKKIVFHYTNWRVAKSVLGESEIINILDTWNIDKKRAMTTDWGLPGYESGAIYTHLIDKIGKAIYQEHDYLLGGMDFGWGTDKNSSKTVCYFMGASVDTGIDVYGEYVSDNKIKVKDNHVLAKEIIDFYVEHMTIYCNRLGYAAFIPMRVRVDFMNTGIISLLNQVAQMRGMRWLQFIKCNKAYTTPDRIEITKIALGRQLVRFSDKIKELKSNMEFSHYEDTEMLKRIKQNDDGLNAFEY